MSVGSLHLIDPKLAGLLSELEQGLGSLIRDSGVQPSTKKDRKEEDVLGINTCLIKVVQVKCSSIIILLYNCFFNQPRYTDSQ